MHRAPRRLILAILLVSSTLSSLASASNLIGGLKDRRLYKQSCTLLQDKRAFCFSPLKHDKTGRMVIVLISEPGIHAYFGITRSELTAADGDSAGGFREWKLSVTPIHPYTYERISKDDFTIHAKQSWYYDDGGIRFWRKATASISIAFDTFLADTLTPPQETGRWEWTETTPR